VVFLGPFWASRGILGALRKRAHNGQKYLWQHKSCQIKGLLRVFDRCAKTLLYRHCYRWSGRAPRVRETRQDHVDSEKVNVSENSLKHKNQLVDARVAAGSRGGPRVGFWDLCSAPKGASGRSSLAVDASPCLKRGVFRPSPGRLDLTLAVRGMCSEWHFQ